MYVCVCVYRSIGVSKDRDTRLAVVVVAFSFGRFHGTFGKSNELSAIRHDGLYIEHALVSLLFSFSLVFSFESSKEK